jgi:hypothetical protein
MRTVSVSDPWSPYCRIGARPRSARRARRTTTARRQPGTTIAAITRARRRNLPVTNERRNDDACTRMIPVRRSVRRRESTICTASDQCHAAGEWIGDGACSNLLPDDTPRTDYDLSRRRIARCGGSVRRRKWITCTAITPRFHPKLRADDRFARIRPSTVRLRSIGQCNIADLTPGPSPARPRQPDTRRATTATPVRRRSCPRAAYRRQPRGRVARRGVTLAVLHLSPVCTSGAVADAPRATPAHPPRSDPDLVRAAPARRRWRIRRRGFYDADDDRERPEWTQAPRRRQMGRRATPSMRR